MLQMGKQARRERVLGAPKLPLHNRQSQARPLSQGLTTWSGPFPSFSLGGADAGGYFAVRFLHLGEDDPSSILGSWEIGGKQPLGGPQPG